MKTILTGALVLSYVGPCIIYCLSSSEYSQSTQYLCDYVKFYLGFWDLNNRERSSSKHEMKMSCSSRGEEEVAICFTSNKTNDTVCHFTFTMIFFKFVTESFDLNFNYTRIHHRELVLLTDGYECYAFCSRLTWILRLCCISTIIITKQSCIIEVICNRSKRKKMIVPHCVQVDVFF